MAGTEEANPTAAAAVNRLRRWAIAPDGGGAIFRWGTDGDYKRCTDFYMDKMPRKMVNGWCATLHRLATGATPGHASTEVAAAKARDAAKR